MHKTFETVRREADSLESSGHPFLAKLLRDALATNSQDRVNCACVRVAAILDIGKRYTEARRVREIARNSVDAMRAKLWGSAVKS